MPFEIVGDISQIETIAVRLRSGTVRRAEVHWYEAHGIGKKEVKRKRYVD